jgi:membrane peptidoglycan carboxypeptidase
MRKAIVSIEDDRFYEHGALDIRGTIRAFIANQASSMWCRAGRRSPSSTSRCRCSKREDRQAARCGHRGHLRPQAAELRYAVAVEDSHSKKWILEQYLNIAYFGDGVYGVEAAAQHYFSPPRKKLSLTQAALLAGWSRTRPPTTHHLPDAAIGRRDVVLDRMRELRVISKDRARRALQARSG